LDYFSKIEIEISQVSELVEKYLLGCDLILTSGSAISQKWAHCKKFLPNSFQILHKNRSTLQKNIANS
jgi:hypothetical protein